MAQRHKSRLILISVIHPPLIDLKVFRKDEKRQKKEYFHRLNEFKDRLQKEFEIEVETFVERGSSHKKVLEFKKKFAAELVISGRGFRHNLKGSELRFDLKMVSDLRCPLLSVPYSFTHVDFEQVLFPVRYVVGVKNKFQIVKNIINRNYSKVHFLGLEGEEERGVRTKTLGIIDTLCDKVDERGLPDATYSFEKTNNPSESILKHLRRVHADLAVINPGKNIYSGEKVDRKFVGAILKEASAAILFINSAAAKNYGTVLPESITTQ